MILKGTLRYRLRTEELVVICIGPRSGNIIQTVLFQREQEK